MDALRAELLAPRRASLELHLQPVGVGGCSVAHAKTHGFAEAQLLLSVLSAAGELMLQPLVSCDDQEAGDDLVALTLGFLLARLDGGEVAAVQR